MLQRKSSKMRKMFPISTAVAAIISLAACAEPAPRTAAQDRQVDEAMGRVEIEQARTDAVELKHRREEAKAYERSIDAGRVDEAQVHSVEPREHFPAGRPTPSGDLTGEEVRRGP